MFKKKTERRVSVTVTLGAGREGCKRGSRSSGRHQADRGLIAHSWRGRAGAGCSPGWAARAARWAPRRAWPAELARRAAGAAPAARGSRPGGGGGGRRRWGPTRTGGGGEAARAKSRPLGRSARRAQRLGRRRARSEVSEARERQEAPGRWARGADSGTSTRRPWAATPAPGSRPSGGGC